jgi:hypothetical protein
VAAVALDGSFLEVSAPPRPRSLAPAAKQKEKKKKRIDDTASDTAAMDVEPHSTIPRAALISRLRSTSDQAQAAKPSVDVWTKLPLPCFAVSQRRPEYGTYDAR